MPRPPSTATSRRPKGPAAKAEAVAEAFAGRAAWVSERQGRLLTIETLDVSSPGVITASVRLQAETGELVDIDPTRRIVNPPVCLDDGRTLDPAAAFWAVLWDSIGRHPGKGRPGR